MTAGSVGSAVKVMVLANVELRYHPTQRQRLPRAIRDRRGRGMGTHEKRVVAVGEVNVNASAAPTTRLPTTSTTAWNPPGLLRP